MDTHISHPLCTVGLVLTAGNSELFFYVWFGLVYLFIHSVTYVTLDMSITDYNLCITTQLVIYGHPHNTI